MILKDQTGIYQIINLVNEIIYIGSAKDLHIRRIGHFSALKNNRHYNSYLQRAWNKYGEENFWFVILEYCNEDQLIEKEQFYIDTFDTFNNGYNLRPKANNNLGYKHKEETKEKMSNVHIGKEISKESVKKQAETKIKRGTIYPTEETKKKLSEKVSPMKGKKHTEEAKEKMRQHSKKIYEEGKANSIIGSKKKGRVPWNKGKKLSDEYRKKLSEAHKGHRHSEEHKRKIGEKHKGSNNANYGRKMSEEQKNKIKNNRSDSIPVLQYDLEGNFIKEWPSMAEASRNLKIGVTTISASLKNKRKEKKYKWYYKK